MSIVGEVTGDSPPPELDSVLERLRSQFQSPELSLEHPAQKLSGGFWAENWLLRFASYPGVPIPLRLVLRLAPVSHLATWENTIQSGVARQGYPTPQIYFSETPHGDHRAWCVMDFVDGNPLLPDLSGVRAFATLPRIAVTLSDTLAKAAVDLHRLEIAPIESELANLGIKPISADELINNYLARIDELPDGSQRLALKALSKVRPVVHHKVICHGDFHPFNVLVSKGKYTVLDWTSAQIADPTFDLAYTYLLLSYPPLIAPRPLRPSINWIGRRLANRFIASYSKRINTGFCYPGTWRR